MTTERCFDKKMPVNLTTEVCGVRFRSPVVPAGGDIVSTVGNCKNMIAAGAGAITTKTYTSVEMPRSRPHPNTFALKGQGFEQGGALFSVIGNWPEHIDIVLKRDIPKFRNLCQRAGIPLIVSWYGPIEITGGKLNRDVQGAWVEIAKKVEAAGADLQEINLGCPLVSNAIKECPSAGFELVKAVCDAGFPAGLKINPTWEPLEELAGGWVGAGAKFITAHNLDTMGLVIDVEKEVPKYVPGVGGYSPGRLFLPWSLSRVARIKKAVDIPVFAAGGVYTAEDALQYILCGASVVEIHTAIYFRGLGILNQINQDIKGWMKRKGYSSLDDFRGKVLPMVLSWLDVKNHEKYPYVVPPECPYVPVVDEKKCDLCRVCAACIHAVYKFEDDQLVIDESKCDNCGLCVTLCPKGAIRLVDKKDRKKVIWNGLDVMAAPFREMIREKLGIEVP